MRRKPYIEGDWFAVPLSRGYALGRIARVGKRGGILLGYFFPSIYDSLPSINDLQHFRAEEAFYITKFGDRGLVEDGWPILGNMEAWSPEAWPLPWLGRIDVFAPGRGYRVRYDEKELALVLEEQQISAQEAMNIPMEGMAGHLYLQGVLENYFRDGYHADQPSNTKQIPIWFRGLSKDALIDAGE